MPANNGFDAPAAGDDDFLAAAFAKPPFGCANETPGAVGSTKPGRTGRLRCRAGEDLVPVVTVGVIVAAAPDAAAPPLEDDGAAIEPAAVCTFQTRAFKKIHIKTMHD